MPWTQFWDMHSGGGLKEDPYHYIYIEAPEWEARLIFYNKFGHSPDRVSCTCCGEDYSIDEHESLFQATGYHRHCWYAHRGRKGKYVAPGKVPKGWKCDRKPVGIPSDKYQTMKEYEARKDVLIIRKKDIRPCWRKGEVPQEGYVWV
jgi:hypothetical protein